MKELLTSWFEFGAYTRQPRALRHTWNALAQRLQTFPVLKPRSWRCPSLYTDTPCAHDTKRGNRNFAPGACKCGQLQVPEKAAIPAWSAFAFEGARAQGHQAATGQLAVIEYDGTASLADIRARWAGWEHVAHTSWSHRPDDPRARVVLPLARTITAAEWPSVFASLRAHDDRTDGQCSDATRLWFLPFARPASEAWHEPGEPWPVPDGDGTGGAPATPDGSVSTTSSTRPPRHNRPTAHAPRDQEDRRYPISERYRTDVGLREQLALRLGGRVTRDRADHVPCPSCGRPSVWWWLSPTHPGASQAQCKHGNSCGWRDWLDQLDLVRA